MLEIAGRTFDSRLILGTGGFRNLEAMAAAAARLRAPSWPPWPCAGWIPARAARSSTCWRRPGC